MGVERRELAETSGSGKVSDGEGASGERAGKGNDEDKEIREKKEWQKKEKQRKSS